MNAAPAEIILLAKRYVDGDICRVVPATVVQVGIVAALPVSARNGLAEAAKETAGETNEYLQFQLSNWLQQISLCMVK
jgi:hypothetical protein